LKIRLVGAEFYVNGQTDQNAEASTGFSQFLRGRLKIEMDS